MCIERRSMPAAAMQPDEHGCTVLGAWARHRLQLLEHAQWQQSEPAGVGALPPAAVQRIACKHVSACSTPG